jgi:hypothetical protein
MSAKAVIVVRSSGERTLQVCVDLIKNQSNDFQVQVIEEQPFDKALLSCYKIGLKSGAEWLITVDADMYLVDDAIKTLLAEAEKMPPNYFQLQGTIFDYITGSVRWAGPRIYRTAFLAEAIRHLESSETRIRPEYSTIQHMAKMEYPSRSISKVLCLHDFDQYYKDLYRKAFVHAIKHDEMLTELVRRCKSEMTKYPDFRVILKGLWDGVGAGDGISIDSRLFTTSADIALSELQIVEKSDDLSTVSNAANNELQRVRNLNQPLEYQDHFLGDLKEDSRLDAIKTIFAEKGVIRGFSHLGGIIFSKIGSRLQSF